MIFAINSTILLNIIHLSCYLLALIPSIFVALSIDYCKFIKARSNKVYYIVAFVVAASFTYLVGEFLYSILTMFII